MPCITYMPTVFLSSKSTVLSNHQVSNATELVVQNSDFIENVNVGGAWGGAGVRAGTR
jgi:hypothetical protein